MIYRKIMWWILFVLQLPIMIFVKKTRRYHKTLKRNVIVASNHQSIVDPIMIYITFIIYYKKELRFIASDILDKKFLVKSYLDFYKSIRVHKNDRKRCIEESVMHLNNDGSIAIFPEGKRTTSKKNKAKTGVIRMAIESRTPIIPIRIKSSQKIIPIGKRIPRIHRTEMIIGRKISYEQYYDKKIDYETLRKLSDELLKTIHSLE